MSTFSLMFWNIVVRFHRKMCQNYFVFYLCVFQDKTFGLKNKKGSKNQKYIAQVEKQVKSGGDPRARKVEEERLAEKKRKEEAKQAEEERKLLSKPVATQKVAAGKIWSIFSKKKNGFCEPKHKNIPSNQPTTYGSHIYTLFIWPFISGVDPKSVFCAFFKQGLCKKGDKCKFSHDPAVERKSAKRNLYEDTDKDENMEDWDEDKLADVVSKKHGAEKTNQTDIVSFYKKNLHNFKSLW